MNNLTRNLRDGILALRFGVILAVLVTGNTLGLSLAQAQSAGRTDPLLNNGPPVWDTNHDGIFTCEEWKKFMEQLFASGDKGRKGFLTKRNSKRSRKPIRSAEPISVISTKTRTAKSRARSSSKSRAYSSALRQERRLPRNAGRIEGGNDPAADGRAAGTAARPVSLREAERCDECYPAFPGHAR